MRHPRGIQLVQLDLDHLAGVVPPADCADEVIAIVTLGREALGRVRVPAEKLGDPQRLLAHLDYAFGDGSLRTRLLGRAVAQAVRGPGRPSNDGHPLRTLVVVEAGSRPQLLPECLESVHALETSPSDVLVVDTSSDGGRARSACERHGVQRMEWRGRKDTAALEAAVQAVDAEVVAFTREACLLQPDWLNDLGRTFSDPLIMAATGFVAPASLDSEPELTLEREGGFNRPIGRLAIDGASCPSPVRSAVEMGSWGNIFFRRVILGESGMPFGAGLEGRSSLSELYAMYKLLTVGFRVVYDPARVVRHRHPLTNAAVLRCLAASGASRRAFGLVCLLRHREPDAARLLRDSFRAPSETQEISWIGARPARSAPRRRPRAAVVQTPTALLPGAQGGNGTSGPTLSIIVPSLNRRDSLRQVLDALESQTYTDDLYEVIVVLDGCTDGSGAMTRERDPKHSLRLIEQPHRGLAASRNAGANVAEGSLLVFLDDDIVPVPGFVAAHAKAHEDAGHRGVVIGECVSRLTEGTFWALQGRTWWDDHFRRKGEPDHPWTALDYSAGNSSISREWFEVLGSFDERFERRNEEQEFGVRLIHGGASFSYCREARGDHYIETDFSRSLEQHRLQGFNDVLLAETHPALASRLVVAAYLGSRSPGLSRRAWLVYRHAEVLGVFTPLVTSLVATTEHLKLRRPHYLFTGWLMAHAYLRGLRDALPTRERLIDFSRAFLPEELADSVEIELGSDRGIKHPTRSANFTVRLTRQGHLLAEAPAMEPGRDWDWEELVGRLVSLSYLTVRERLSLEELRVAGTEVGSSDSIFERER